MPKQLVLIGARTDLGGLPSAKVRLQDKSGVHGWTDFYASFSEGFVNQALRSMGAKADDTVYDPFIGSGTTGVSALKMGLRSVGADIDPFACLLSRAKVAIRADRRQVLSVLRGKPPKSPERSFLPEAESIFSSGCLAYAHSIFNNVLQRTRLNRETLLNELLHDSTGLFDSEVVAITSLCTAATRAALLVRGSNPTWFRRAKQGEQIEVSALRLATSETAATMLNDLNDLAATTISGHSLFHNVDARHWPQHRQQPFADFVVTSPPYLSRIDYVVKHLPHLLLLSGLIDINVENLRRGMVGTSKIVDKSVKDIDWGPSASRIVSEIRDHSSYASARYYRWVYQQYFAAIYDSLSAISRAVKLDGKGVLVVQDAFYKDVFIDLGAVVVEMLTTLAFTGKVVRIEPIKKNLRQLNPRRSRTPSVANESVIYFERQSRS